MKQLQEGKGGPQTATISHTHRIPATSRQLSLKGQDLNTSILPLQRFPAHARYQELGQLWVGGRNKGHMEVPDLNVIMALLTGNSWIRILALPLTSCQTLGEPPNLSGPQLSHL